MTSTRTACASSTRASRNGSPHAAASPRVPDVARPSRRGSTVATRAGHRHLAAFVSWEDSRAAESRLRLRAKADAQVGDALDASSVGTRDFPRAGASRNADFVEFFRQASPYIANHRGATFVVVVPGSVMVDPDRTTLEGIVQDVAMLNSLGVRVAMVLGSAEQVNEMSARRGVPTRVVGGYRVTTSESLEIAMEAAGRNNVLVQALFSRGVHVAVTRKHGDRGDHADSFPFGSTRDPDRGAPAESFPDAFAVGSFGRSNGGAVATSGNFITAKRRGIVDGVDFLFTGDVVSVDAAAIDRRLRQGDVVLLSSLGFNAAGEVLNCQCYDVAVSLAVDMSADKLIAYVAPRDMPRDEDGRRAKYMPLSAAEAYMGAAAASAASGGFPDATPAGTASRREARKRSTGDSPSSFEQKRERTVPEPWRWLNSEEGFGIDEARDVGVGALGSETTSRDVASAFRKSPWRRFSERGFRWRVDGCPQELSAAVFSCKAGVRRAHLIEYTVPGALLLELYTLDGVGAMVSRDRYEGTRGARLEDWIHIKTILEPLAREGIVVGKSDEELVQEVTSGSFAVTERDGKIIACAALRRYETGSGGSGGSERVAEVAAFAVRPGYRNEGRGDQLLEYLETRAKREGVTKLFLLTTRTADWFTSRGFLHAGKAEDSPLLPKGKKTVHGRNSQLYIRTLLE